MEIFAMSYNELSVNSSHELFSLRKDVFKDRLNWAVKCFNDMEFDEYDNQNTTYLLGLHNKVVLCSLRFIEIQYPNMITGTFRDYFDLAKLPEGNYIESSRFFVDKMRSQHEGCNNVPLSTMLFLGALNYAKKHAYDGILTIISHPMLIIMKRSGWKLTIIDQGISEKNESIYLLQLPVDEENQNILINKINRNGLLYRDLLGGWPLTFTPADSECQLS